MAANETGDCSEHPAPCYPKLLPMMKKVYALASLNKFFSLLSRMTHAGRQVHLQSIEVHLLSKAIIQGWYEQEMSCNCLDSHMHFLV